MKDAKYEFENEGVINHFQLWGKITHDSLKDLIKWKKDKKEAEEQEKEFKEEAPEESCYLVELDTRTTLSGENIPAPERVEGKHDEFKKYTIPHYVECDVPPLKYMFRQRYLTWMN